MEQISIGTGSAEIASAPGLASCSPGPGAQLGHYRLRRPLGSGGFAEVYLGEHLHLGTEVAIKLLRPPLAPGLLARFREEARIAAHLCHPHIVRVFDFMLLEETAFLVMEYAPTGTLRRRHPRGTRLPPALILAYLRQIGAALDYAHRQGCIHCDIKPENMLIGRQNEILLSDFGIAALVEQGPGKGEIALGEAAEIAGTVTYMAPEQLAGRPQCASDQYALGVVVYEWLCGEPPFRGTPAEVLAQQINRQPPSLRERLPQLSPRLAEVVARALAKKPEERYPGVLDFVKAFERALSCGERPRAQGSSPAVAARPPALPPAPRRTLVAGLLALATSGLLGGSLTWLACLERIRCRPPLPACPLPLSHPPATTVLPSGERRSLLPAPLSHSLSQPPARPAGSP
jgi:serine/threonine protein kinase